MSSDLDEGAEMVLGHQDSRYVCRLSPSAQRADPTIFSLNMPLTVG